MKLYVNVKQVGKRKNYITLEEINLSFKPLTIRELIQAVVTDNVCQFNKKIRDKSILAYLTEEEIDEKIILGKVTFGEHYNENEAKLSDAIENALLSYEDGIYRILIGDHEAGTLDSEIHLEEGNVLTFIRLTMLAGRMW